MVGKIKPIPNGFHTLTPSLIVRNGMRAIEFYKKAFDAEELGCNYGPDGKSIMHANLKIGDSILMLSDEFPAMNCHSPQSIGGSSVTIHVYVDDVDKMFNQAILLVLCTHAIDGYVLGRSLWTIVDPFGQQMATCNL